MYSSNHQLTVVFRKLGVAFLNKIIILVYINLGIRQIIQRQSIIMRKYSNFSIF